LDTGQRQRIQTIIDLMRRAKMAIDENTDSANGIAVSLLHDAIEHTLYLVLLDGHQTPKRREEFNELVAAVAVHYRTRANRDMPFRRQLSDLNALRIAFKHRGSRPSRGSTLEAYSNGSAFLEVLFSDLFALRIEDFDLVDQLRIAEIRNHLIESRNLLRQGNFDEAMCESAVANFGIDRALVAIFDQPRPPLSLSNSFVDRTARELVEYISSGDRHALVTSVLIASGQDISAQITTDWYLPVVYALLDGTFRFDKITPDPYTAERVQMRFNHVAKTATWMEERFPALDYLDGRWKTGAVSPWPN
jgi:hypothetical protein